MRRWIGLAFALLLVGGCASGNLYQPDESFSYFNQHCREHARDMVGEADEELRYQECMRLHGFYSVPETDLHLSGAH